MSLKLYADHPAAGGARWDGMRMGAQRNPSKHPKPSGLRCRGQPSKNPFKAPAQNTPAKWRSECLDLLCRERLSATGCVSQPLLLARLAPRAWQVPPVT